MSQYIPNNPFMAVLGGQKSFVAGRIELEVSKNKKKKSKKVPNFFQNVEHCVCEKFKTGLVHTQNLLQTFIYIPH